jgi:hypothetical protein
MEVIDLGLSDLEPVNINFTGDDYDGDIKNIGGSSSVNFGGGLEF